MKINVLKGMYDVLPEEVVFWQFIEKTVRETAALFGYGEIRTPILERTELFKRGSGIGTDIVKKEMYIFEDRGGRSVTLRPEGTPSVVRAYLQSGVTSQGEIAKLFYIAPMFRYEKPQKGRFRQHVQFGAECFGIKNPAIDAEMIIFLLTIYARLGLKGFVLELNNVGCGKKECRESVRKGIKDFVSGKTNSMCDDCKLRLEENPLRILDCKKEGCIEILSGFEGTDSLACESCRSYYKELKDLLSANAMPFVENSRLVRGLDYYTAVVFEVTASGLGSQNAIGGGGRYDNMVKELGGPDVPAVGFGAGIERVIMALKSQCPDFPVSTATDVFVVYQGEKALKKVLFILNTLRLKLNISAKAAFGKSMKAQMRTANKLKSKYCIIVGDEEINKGVFKLKNMESGEEKEITENNLKSIRQLFRGKNE
ncbi:MAG: histidine--tRNA ligase [Candidatus Aureabacteria bacterium]|nr:histidine--tRNA ligase [Candidatus Auribacterota bacterium]